MLYKCLQGYLLDYPSRQSLPAAESPCSASGSGKRREPRGRWVCFEALVLHHEARGAGSSVESAPATETNEVRITVEHDFDPRAKPPAVNVLVGPRQHLVNIGVSHVPLLACPCGQAGRRIAAKVDPVHGLIDLPSGRSEKGGQRQGCRSTR